MCCTCISTSTRTSTMMQHPEIRRTSSSSMDEYVTSPTRRSSQLDDDVDVDAAVDLCYYNGGAEVVVDRTDEEEEEKEKEEYYYEADDSEDDDPAAELYVSESYQHWREHETEIIRPPSVNCIRQMTEIIIDREKRSHMVYWLVETADFYSLVPDTLYLAVNYMDRFFSGNPSPDNVLAAACLMIAPKYEGKRRGPQMRQLEDYLYNFTGYTKSEVFEMESSVLNYLEFEIATPTTLCFLRLCIRVAAEEADDDEQVPLLHQRLELECMASYVAELSLVDYTMNCYAPSLIAASSIFLAKFILSPSKRPWTLTLENYTLYKPSDLQDCVQALRQLCIDDKHHNHSDVEDSIRKKYSRDKYKLVATKHCPPIPSEFFNRIST